MILKVLCHTYYIKDIMYGDLFSKKKIVRGFNIFLYVISCMVVIFCFMLVRVLRLVSEPKI